MMTTFKFLMLLLLLGPLWEHISYTLRIISAAVASLVWLLSKLRSRRKWRAHVGGHVAKGFERVEQVFRQNVESGEESGAAFAVYYKGQLVVDLWGGYADQRARRLRQQDTTCLFYSATKAVTAIVIASLVDRGLLDYEKPVCEYWPEFAANGKQSVKVGTLLSHGAGLLTITQRHKLSLIRDDPEKLGSLLAQQKPLWKPGTRVGYHALTYGLYADQLVRQVDKDKRSLSRFFQEEIAKPFDIEFYIGEPPSLYYRSARENLAIFGWKFIFTIFLPHAFSFGYRVIRSILYYRTIYLLKFIGSPVDWKFRHLNNPTFRQLESPASHGVGTARGLAKLMGIVGNGGSYEGKQLLSSESISRLGRPLNEEYDVVVMKHISYGPGVVILQAEKGTPREHSIFGHWGAGGQMAFCDTRYGLGWAYGTNYANILHGSLIDHRYQALQDALYECMHELEQC